MFGLGIIDILMIVGYFVGIFWIGYRASKNIGNTEDFFLGGRKFGRVIATFTVFGQGTSAESAVASTTQVKRMGISGIMLSIFPNIFYLPTYYFAAKWYRRLRLITMADYYKLRYKSDGLAMFYSISQAFIMTVVVGMGFIAMSKTIMAITPKPVEEFTVEQKMQYDNSIKLHKLESTDYTALTDTEKVQLEELRLEQPRRSFSYFNKPVLVLCLAVVVLIYAIGGGLEAAAKTDVLQSILTLLLTVMFIPFGFAKINATYGSEGVLGAFQTMHKVLPASLFDLFGSPANAEMTWYLMLAMGTLTLPNSLCGANQLVVAGAAKDDKTARAGFVDGMLIKRFATVMWGLIGMIILTLFFNNNSDPDLMWGMATRELLGSLNIGLSGLMIACLMAALMSTADAMMLVVAGLLTDGVYKTLRPGKEDRHYILAGRVACVIFLVGAVSMAMYCDDIWSTFKYFLTLGFVFAAAFLVPIIWRRANAKGAWASVICSGLVSFLLPLIAPMAGFNTNEAFLITNTSQQMETIYTASSIDVEERQAEILKWKELDAKGMAITEIPAQLTEGQEFTKVFASKERAVFWDSIKSVKDDAGNITLRGEGMFKADMFLLHTLRVPLQKLSFPMLETLRFITQFLVSFLPIIIVSSLTKPMDDKMLDKFYGRLRTPATSDHDFDRKEMEKTEADPTRFDHEKLFPKSSLEICKWHKYETMSVLKILGYVMLIYVSLIAIVKIGA